MRLARTLLHVPLGQQEGKRAGQVPGVQKKRSSLPFLSTNWVMRSSPFPMLLPQPSAHDRISHASQIVRSQSAERPDVPMDKKFRFIPTYTDEQLQELRTEGFLWTVRHAQNSPQYREIFRKAGVQAEDIHSLDDLTLLPTTDADDLRAGYPFPLLCVPEKDVVRVHASSGTTGKRKILAYTARDVQTFNTQMARCYEMAGLTPEDRMQVAVGYGLWTAGAGFQMGSELYGLMTIPVGPGNLQIHLQLMEDLGTTCFGATASMALLLAEEVERAGIRDRLKLRTIICGSEMRSEKMRIAMESKLGLEGSYDIGGMTEMYGPGTAIECSLHTGLHYWADLFIIEILDPVTHKPLPMGEVGEMVVTSLCKEAAPLIRYRTHDLARLIPGKCECGLNMPRHSAILGRSDDMIIFRGVNIYPGQIADVLGKYSEVGSEYQIQLTRDEAAVDHMKITIERAENMSSDSDRELAQRIAQDMHTSLFVRVDVVITDPSTLPRTFSKSKRIVDLR